MLNSYNKVFAQKNCTVQKQIYSAKCFLKIRNCPNRTKYERIRCDLWRVIIYSEIKNISTNGNWNMAAFEILQYTRITVNSLMEIIPNLYTAFWILLTSPVSVASPERSFFKLKLIKTYLRSKISQDRFSGLALISVENELSRSSEYSNWWVRLCESPKF
jgi:hypothetical protein